MSKTQFKFKVNIIESEAGWSQKLYEVKEFDTYEEAVNFIRDHNLKNNEEQVPSFYWKAEPGKFSIHS